MKHWYLPHALLVIVIALVLSSCTTPEPAPITPATPTATLAEMPGSNNTPPASPSPPTAAVLADFGPAPELHNETWLNSAAPLRLAELRGQVVLLEMWTFG